MDQAAYFKCTNCGYEFLSKLQGATCPRCKSSKLETKGLNVLTDLDE